MELDKAAVACSLGPRDIEKRREEWNDLLVANVVERRVIPGGVRLALRPSEGVAARLRRLIELEKACCAWISWSIVEGDVVELDATAYQPQGTELLRGWFGMTPA